jgi:hypothetical protein
MHATRGIVNLFTVLPCPQAKGQEYTKFYRRETRRKKTSSSTYKQVNYRPDEEKATIFKAKAPLLGKGELVPGNYEFPVAFQLPADLPSSFEFNGVYNERQAM